MTRHARRTVRYSYALLLTGALILTTAYLIPFWPGEIIASFLPQEIAALLALTICVILFHLRQRGLTGRRFQLAIVGGTALALALPIAMVIMNTAGPHTPPPKVTADNSIRFATLNRLYTNDRLEDIAAHMNKTGVDVLAVQESDEMTVHRLGEKAGYDYRVTTAASSDTGMGVGIISRLPIATAKSIPLGSSHGIVRAEIDVRGSGPAAFYSTHLATPIAPSMYVESKDHLARLARQLQQEKLPLVLGGDFNTTVYSPKMRQFEAAVADTARTTTGGVLPECSWFGGGPLFCMRIDHIFVSPNATTSDITVAPDLGSDHRMLITDIRPE